MRSTKPRFLFTRVVTRASRGTDAMATALLRLLGGVDRDRAVELRELRAAGRITGESLIPMLEDDIAFALPPDYYLSYERLHARGVSGMGYVLRRDGEEYLDTDPEPDAAEPDAFDLMIANELRSLPAPDVSPPRRWRRWGKRPRVAGDIPFVPRKAAS